MSAQISCVLTNLNSWSPLHELVPETPLRHGHAISIDMAYSATLANERGLLSDEEHKRLLNLFSRAGLSMDHPQFDEDILEKATAAILKVRSYSVIGLKTDLLTLAFRPVTASSELPFPTPSDSVSSSTTFPQKR